MAKSTVALIARALVSAHPSCRLKQSFIHQRQLLGKVRNFYLSNKVHPLLIGKMCKELGVSERSLRDAFQKQVGISPLNYFKMVQLNLIYRALRQASSNEKLIKKIAYKNGFTHPGQFARDYKQLFGELPSQTRQACTRHQ
jgi:AraC family ethanolamine operon transcriptional activator